MIRARLIARLRYDKDEGGNPKEQDWGEFDFDALPAEGDRVEVVRDHELRMLAVKFVLHLPAPYPREKAWLPSLQRTNPVQHIIADAL